MAKKKPTWGLMVLAVYLILSGMVSLIHLSFQGLSMILGLLALVAGILLLVGR